MGDAEQLVEADDDVASHAKDKRRWRASKGMNAPPKLPTDGTDHGGMLPHISVQYLPYTIVGFMLAVPILTVSVLKGCWFLIDLFVPMQGAPQPDVCRHACMPLYMHAYVPICMHACVRMRMRAYEHAFACVHMFVHACLYVHMLCAFMYAFMYTYMYALVCACM